MAQQIDVSTHIEELPSRSEQLSYPQTPPLLAAETGFVAQLHGKSDHSVIATALATLADIAAHAPTQTESASSGLLVQLPGSLVSNWAAEITGTNTDTAPLVVGMCFLPQDVPLAAQARNIVETVCVRRHLQVLGWRIVPIVTTMLTTEQHRDMPRIEQVIVQANPLVKIALPQLLLLIRREIETEIRNQGLSATIVSLSHTTVIYKAMVNGNHLADIYPDLQSASWSTTFAIFHLQQFASTEHRWQMAQPFHTLAYGGTITTIDGNRMWANTRQEHLLTTHWPQEQRWLRPWLDPNGNDAAHLDNVVELLTCSHVPIVRAMTMVVPPAWKNDETTDPELQIYFEEQATRSEPWDGTGATIGTDGTTIVARVDRRGTQPLFTTYTQQHLLIVASVPAMVSENNRETSLTAGMMIALNTKDGTVWHSSDLKSALHLQPEEIQRAGRLMAKLYDREIEQGIVSGPHHNEQLLEKQILFGYTLEDVEMVIRAMALNGKELIWSMGDDTQLAALTEQPRSLATYFRHNFVQVIQSAADAYTEATAISLSTFLGAGHDPLAMTQPTTPSLQLSSPILSERGLMDVLTAARNYRMKVTHLATTYRMQTQNDPSGNLIFFALEALESRAITAVQSGTALLLLSDQDLHEDDIPLPLPLAISAVHNALVRAGLRHQTSIIVETGTAWDIHHMTLILGYGAGAIVPYLALETARSLSGTKGFEDISEQEAERNYRAACEHGLRRAMARMGVTTFANYIGTHPFTSIGLTMDLVDRFFPQTHAIPGTVTLSMLHRQICKQQEAAEHVTHIHHLNEAAFNSDDTIDLGATVIRPRLPDRGMLRYKRNMEQHATTPQLVKALQQFAQTGDSGDYQKYAHFAQHRLPTSPRDTLTFVSTAKIPIEQVESATGIARQFVCGALSQGAISPEASLALAVGFNRIGAHSSTGESGEVGERMGALKDGVRQDGNIKQIGPGRFGVTTSYLVHAQEIEIKIAQGANPGENDYLPGRKMTTEVAALRHSQTRLPSYSPAAHLDLHNLAELAELIQLLREINPTAKIGVKIAVGHNKGNVAVAIAATKADYIHISGNEGSTGAAPLSALKSVGLPWELGLATAHIALQKAGYRSSVRLRVDGGLKTGRDVVMAALLGANEFAFGTTALVAIGCDMNRQCHLDTCPTGIATQREELRKRFSGSPEQVVRVFMGIAEEVRTILAQLGFRSLEEAIGRADTLKATIDHLNMQPLLDGVVAVIGLPQQSNYNEDRPHDTPLTDAAILTDIQHLSGNPKRYVADVAWYHHNIGSRVAGELTRRWGSQGLAHGSVDAQLHGNVGNYLGAFSVHGMCMTLNGNARNGVGTGMAGGEIIVTNGSQPAKIGATALYGATGGTLLVSGHAGNHFAARNSGAVGIVENVGAYSCEYMTSGAVVILGDVDTHLAEGMTGGVIYVYHPVQSPNSATQQHPSHQLQTATIQIERLSRPAEITDLYTLLTYYVEATANPTATKILAHWQEEAAQFWRILPRGIKVPQRPLAEIAASQAQQAAEILV